MEDSTTTRLGSTGDRLPPPSRDGQPRQIETPRNATAPRSAGRSIEVYEQLPAKVIPDVSPALVIGNPGDLSAYGQPDLTLHNGVSNTGQTQQPITPYYDISNPLGLSADLFSKFFSNAPTDSPQSPVVVGDVGASSGTSSNAGLLLVLAILGIGGYFLYRRFKQ